MGYSHIDPSGLPAAPDRPSTKRSISDAAGLEQFAAHRYEVAPGEAIPLAYHVHDEQEELFYVTAGELHVKTPERDYVVAADEVFAEWNEWRPKTHVSIASNGPASPSWV
jgi:uncharacterized cupin superfamily protein